MVLLIQPKVDDNREARAPYNFIPLPEKVITVSVNDLPDQGVYNPNLLTGYIECKLTTSSPLYVRAGLASKEAKSGKQSKEQPDFFYLNDKKQPVIPGSSLRGMLRTLVEIVTFSKIGSVSKTPLVYRSVGGTTNHDENYRFQMMKSDDKKYMPGATKHYTPRIKGGYLVKVGARDWAIRPAKTFDGTTYAHIGKDKFDLNELTALENCKNAYKIFIKAGPFQHQQVKGGFLENKFAKVIDFDSSGRPGLRPATLALSGPMFSKKSEAVVYESDEDADLLPLSDDQVDMYVSQRTKKQEELLGKDGALNSGQPIFYVLNEKSGKVSFFGHARMFRVPYNHSPFDYVPEYARPIDNPDDPSIVDFAEAMFGYTRNSGKGKERAYAGRITLSDATLESGQSNLWLSEKPVKLKVLASPKPTTFQHYLVQPEPNYYPSEKPTPETRLCDYDMSIEETAIRGHKFYWHKGQVGLDDIQQSGKVKDTQTTEVYPLRAGVLFGFRVNFENLTEEELGALMWIFDQSAKEHMRLKIGMGKPLGMGAIKITPNLFIQKPRKRYSALLLKNKWESGYELQNDLALKTVEKFSAKILDELNEDLPPEKKLDDFTKSPHIRNLLVMLQWPGMELEWSRYMEIEYPDKHEKNGKRNEYKERPVLPSPFGVWSKHKKQ